MRTAERTGTALPTTRLQPLPRHPGRRHAVPQRLSGVPPRSRPSARPHPAIAATAGDLAEPGGDRTDRTDPHRRLRPARHRAAPLSRHGLLHRPRRPRRWLLQPAPVVGTASGLREDRPPLRRRHPPGHRETRVRRLHPEDGPSLSRPGHRRRHRTAEELAVLSEMGVDLVQGYLFGRPQEHPASDVQQMLPSAGAPASLPATSTATCVRCCWNSARSTFAPRPRKWWKSSAARPT